MNEIRIFNNPEFGNVRTVEINGEPYFVGKDVSEILGYSNVNKAIQMHVDEEDKINLDFKGFSHFGTILWKENDFSNKIVINESGLYSLILSSKLPKAKEFKHWVTKEVLPSIHKTGTYSLPSKPDSYLIEDPAERARRWAEEYEEKAALEVENAELIEKNDELESENAYMRPKAAYFDALVDRETLTNIRETAQELGIPQNEFTEFLKDNNFIYYKRTKYNKLIRAYSRPVKDGLFQIKEYKTKHGWKGTQVLVTPKGRHVFGKLLGVIKDYTRI